jgi:hypothetical protein
MAKKHDDAAEDRKLIRAELKKKGLKSGGYVPKKTKTKRK